MSKEKTSHYRPVVIRLVGLSGQCKFQQLTYLQRWNNNARGGRGSVVVTSTKDEAYVFRNFAEAVAAWRAVSAAYPTRPDGLPNRPLTAFDVEFVPLQEDTPNGMREMRGVGQVLDS